jgi:hypothetical protein
MNRFLLLALPLAAAACSSSSGPVAPTTLASPETQVIIHPVLASMLTVPAEPNPSQDYRYTPDGLLQYYFRLQNLSGQRVHVRILTTFFDEQGFPVDEQQKREFLAEAETQTIVVTCSNTKGKRVQVQVLGLQ